jgi:hypothetical protein
LKNNIISDKDDRALEVQDEKEEKVKSEPVKAAKSKHIKIELTEKLDSEEIAKKQTKTKPVTVASEDSESDFNENEVPEDRVRLDISDSRGFKANDFMSRINTATSDTSTKSQMSPKSLEVTKIVSETPSTLSLFKYAPVAGLVALIAGGVVLSLDSVWSVGEGFFDMDIKFNLASLLEIFQ